MFDRVITTKLKNREKGAKPRERDASIKRIRTMTGSADEKREEREIRIIREN